MPNSNIPAVGDEGKISAYDQLSPAKKKFVELIVHLDEIDEELDYPLTKTVGTGEDKRVEPHWGNIWRTLHPNQKKAVNGFGYGFYSNASLLVKWRRDPLIVRAILDRTDNRVKFETPFFIQTMLRQAKGGKIRQQAELLERSIPKIKPEVAVQVNTQIVFNKVPEDPGKMEDCLKSIKVVEVENE